MTDPTDKEIHFQSHLSLYIKVLFKERDFEVNLQKLKNVSKCFMMNCPDDQNEMKLFDNPAEESLYNPIVIEKFLKVCQSQRCAIDEDVNWIYILSLRFGVDDFVNQIHEYLLTNEGKESTYAFTFLTQLYNFKQKDIPNFQDLYQFLFSEEFLIKVISQNFPLYLENLNKFQFPSETHTRIIALQNRVMTHDPITAQMSTENHSINIYFFLFILTISICITIAALSFLQGKINKLEKSQTQEKENSERYNRWLQEQLQELTSNLDDSHNADQEKFQKLSSKIDDFHNADQEKYQKLKTKIDNSQDANQKKIQELTTKIGMTQEQIQDLNSSLIDLSQLINIRVLYLHPSVNPWKLLNLDFIKSLNSHPYNIQVNQITDIRFKEHEHNIPNILKQYDVLIIGGCDKAYSEFSFNEKTITEIKTYTENNDNISVLFLHDTITSKKDALNSFAFKLGIKDEKQFSHSCAQKVEFHIFDHPLVKNYPFEFSLSKEQGSFNVAPTHESYKWKNDDGQLIIKFDNEHHYYRENGRFGHIEIGHTPNILTVEQELLYNIICHLKMKSKTNEEKQTL